MKQSLLEKDIANGSDHSGTQAKSLTIEEVGVHASDGLYRTRVLHHLELRRAPLWGRVHVQEISPPEVIIPLRWSSYFPPSLG